MNDKYLEDWPVASPDLSPIVNYWGILKSHLYSGGRQFQSKTELRNAILDNSKERSATEIKNLTETMDHWLIDVIRLKGNFIFHSFILIVFHHAHECSVITETVSCLII